jgi:hypothetical protein
MSLLASRGLIKTIESQIETKGICLSDFRESVNITSELVVKIKKRCRQVPIVVDNEPYFTQFKAIFKKNTIDFVDEIPALAWRAELQAHPRMLKDNDHWSDIGQRACGEYLSKFLRDKIKKSVYAEN